MLADWSENNDLHLEDGYNDAEDDELPEVQHEELLVSDSDEDNYEAESKDFVTRNSFNELAAEICSDKQRSFFSGFTQASNEPKFELFYTKAICIPSHHSLWLSHFKSSFLL